MTPVAPSLVTIPTKDICDWPTLHDVFSASFGFPDFYGRNMSAWIDCMTYLDDTGAGMTSIHVPEGGVLTLVLEDVDDFAARCPEQYAAVIESSAFVNWRRLEQGAAPVIALAFAKTP